MSNAVTSALRIVTGGIAATSLGVAVKTASTRNHDTGKRLKETNVDLSRPFPAN